MHYFHFRYNNHPVLNERYLLLMLLGKGGFSEVHKVKSSQITSLNMPLKNRSVISVMNVPVVQNEHRLKRRLIK